ncbi:MAG: hypothetical protein ACPLXO_00600, partial [Desulfurella sp.]
LLFIIVGIIGLASTYIEKNTNKPELIKKDNPSIFSFLFIMTLIIAEVVCAAYVIVELYSGTVNSIIGLSIGFNFILMALIVLFYRKFNIDDEVITQDIKDEIPW